MLYIVRVREGEDLYEYEYGLPAHAQEHLNSEAYYAELFIYQNGQETFVVAVNQNKC